jgi:hypothetical protein
MAMESFQEIYGALDIHAQSNVWELSSPRRECDGGKMGNRVATFRLQHPAD